MNVVDTLAIWRESESPQVPAGKEIGKAPPSFDFEQLKSPRSLSSFLHFIQEQPTVYRNTERLYGGVFARRPFGRIDQKMILAVRPFTHENAGLLLVWQTFSEKVAPPSFSEGVIGFNGKVFSNPLTNALAPRNTV